MGSNGSIGVQNYHELNRMAFKPRSPGSCFTLKEGKKVKSHDSPVPRKDSDCLGEQESRAPNTACSVSCTTQLYVIHKE